MVKSYIFSNRPDPQYTSPLMMTQASPGAASPLGFGVRGPGPGPLSDFITSLGFGLLTGRTPAEGLAIGIQSGNQAIADRRQEQRQARRDQMAEEQFGLERQKFGLEAGEAKREADLRANWPAYVQGLNLDPATAQTIAGLGYDEGSKLLSTVMGEQVKPFTPNLQTRIVGNQEETGYFDRAGNWHTAGAAGPRFNPNSNAGGLSLDLNGDGNPDLTMGNIKSEWQSKDFGFANRLDNALAGMAGAEAGGYDPTASTVSGVKDYIAQRNIGGLVGNALTSDKGRLWYRNAKEALAVALRKDSGAAVTENEFNLYGPLYLPMPWDDAATKANKVQALRVISSSMRAGLGQQPATPIVPATPTAPVAPASAPTNDDPLGILAP